MFSIATYVRVAIIPAYQQNADEITAREPGKYFFGAPQPILPEARKDLPFALLSQAAYQEKADACVDADAALKTMGWIRWKDFPDAATRKEIDKVHLRVEVWSNSPLKAVAVTFGGTDITNIEDWKANLGWFIPHYEDQYTVMVKTFGKAFIGAYLEREARPEWAFLRSADIFSTGHSLGGGLAQEFAFSLPTNPDVPRVKQVFAFDPSPVTGFYTVGEELRIANSMRLRVDRIYENGEILSFIRSSGGSGVDPAIRHLRYHLFRAWNPVAAHSIARLVCKLHAYTDAPGGSGPAVP